MQQQALLKLQNQPSPSEQKDLLKWSCSAQGVAMGFGGSVLGAAVKGQPLDVNGLAAGLVGEAGNRVNSAIMSNSNKPGTFEYETAQKYANAAATNTWTPTSTSNTGAMLDMNTMGMKDYANTTFSVSFRQACVKIKKSKFLSQKTNNFCEKSLTGFLRGIVVFYTANKICGLAPRVCRCSVLIAIFAKTAAKNRIMRYEAPQGEKIVLKNMVYNKLLIIEL